MYQCYNNLIRVNSALTIKTEKGEKNIERTPCMAEGITDHIWTLPEFLYPEKEKIECSYDIPRSGRFSGKSILPYDIPGFSTIPLMTNTMRAIEKGIPLDEIDALDFLKKANKTDLEMLKLVTEKIEALM